MIESSRVLPRDVERATLVGRVWEPQLGGPTPVAIHKGRIFDISVIEPTVSALLEIEDVADVVRRLLVTGGLRDLGPVESVTGCWRRDDQLHLLAPCDLQPIKACGVTFVESLLERVIEERAKGDLGRASELRTEVQEVIGADLQSVRPGSEAAEKLKFLLLQSGTWSQYLEVGIGPDAEVFTKAPPMASVGHASDVGLHPRSVWNNPEPEVVLAVTSAGRIVGAALGNDVNLRDFEGRSALLLGKAKDNNGSCAIGPFIRLFDEHFGLDDVRSATVSLHVTGVDGFELHGKSSMSKISRDPLDLVEQTIGPVHQYPDGLMLFCGTMFAPIQDRDAPGLGFTHKVGDIVTISSERLGALINRVDLSDRIPPWRFGLSELMNNLSRRKLLAARTDH